MADHYAQHVERFEEWLHENHTREDDFFNRLDLEEHETLRQYFNRKAHIPTIIIDTIHKLCGFEVDRATDHIFRQK